MYKRNNYEYLKRPFRTALIGLLCLGFSLGPWSLQAQAATAVVTGSVVNMRSGPGTEYGVAGVIYHDTRLEITGRSGSWNKVRFGAMEGWVHSSLLKESDPQSLIIGVGVANLRSGPGIEYDIVGQASRDEVLTLVVAEGDWYLAQTAAGQGVYVRKDMIAGQVGQSLTYQAANPTPNYSGKNPTMVLNGQTRSFSVGPIMYNNRIMVPLREVFDAVGGTVGWNQAAQTATVDWGSKRIVLPLNSCEPTVNGSVWGTDVPTMTAQNTTLAPLRFIIEALGGTACWDSSTATVYVFIPPADGLKAVGVVVNSSKVNLRSGPGMGYELVAQAANGEQMSILEQQDGWYKVNRDGQTAWVAGWVVEVIWGWSAA